MRKIVAFLLAIMLLCIVLCSCGNKQKTAQQKFDEANAAYQEQKLKVEILKAEIALLDTIINAAGK